MNLKATKLARRAAGPSDPGEQFAMNLAGQVQAERDLRDPPQAEPHGVDVIDDLLHIVWAFLASARLSSQHI